jgi:hypothetical protein
MDQVLEVPIDNWIASFDGRVLEVFTPYQQGSMRYHARLLQNCAIDGNVLTVVFQRQDRGLWPFREEQRAGVERLVQAIEQVRLTA